MLATVLTVLVASHFAMSDTITGQLWNCHIPEKQLKVLSVDPYQIRGYTFDVFRFDRNGDGTQDMLLMYPTANGRRSVFPKYYMYDMDYNGKPDKAYMDTQGNGICAQMQELNVASVLAEKEM